MAPQLFCTSCGWRIDGEVLFCENCGESVSQVHTTAAIVSTAAMDVVALNGGAAASLPLHRTRTAIGTWLAPFNGAVLFGGTVVSVFDFLSPRIVLLPLAAILAASALLLMILARKFIAPDLKSESKMRQVMAPDVVFHKSPLLIMMSVFTALTVTGAAWSGAASATGGVMASKFDMVRGAQMQLGILHVMQKEQRVQTAVLVDIRDGLQVQSAAAGVAAKSADKKTTAILDDTGVIRNAVTRELTAFEALAAQGYGATKYDLCAALIAGNTKAVDLLVKMGFNDQSLILVSASKEFHCLESVFLNIDARFKLRTIAAQLPLNVELLDKYYQPMHVYGDSKMIDSPGLLTELGIIDGVSKIPTIIWIEDATPLLLSVWGNNIEAADFLLNAGVNRDQGARLKITHYKDTIGKYGIASLEIKDYVATLSPLSEAKRLGRKDIVALLINYKAKGEFSKSLIKK